LPEVAFQSAAEPAAQRIRRSALQRASVLLTLGAAAAVFWLAFEEGSYSVGRWTGIAIVLWWTIVAGLLLRAWSILQVPRAAWVFWTLLALFAALSGASGLWASGAERPFLAMDRVLLYEAVVLLAIFVGARWGTRRVADGVAVGLVSVALLAFVSRLAPAHFPDETLSFLPYAHTRLSYPVNYWNGLAVLVALSFPLLLRVAVADERMILRGLALAPLPMVATIIYLASSRTGAVAAFVGIVAFAAMAPDRWTAAFAALTAVVVSAAAILFVAQQHAFVNGPIESDAASTQGLRVAVAVCLLGVLAACVYGLASERIMQTQFSSRLGRVLVGALGAALAVAVLASHPVRRWDNFTRPPAVLADRSYIENHFLSTNGNWRWQYWGSAVDEFRTRPFFGRGAGSYEAWWSEHGRLVGFIGNAHSLYVEVLGELGIVGFVLLVGAFASAAVAGVRRALRSPPRIRSTAAAATAGFLAFAVAAGLDWMWELPAVSVVGMTLLGLAFGSAPTLASRPTSRTRSRRGRLLLLTLVAFGVAALAAEADLFAANAKITDSQRAAARGDFAAAAAAADSAKLLQPWAASPYLQRALVEELRGRLPQARAWTAKALERDDGDWRIWLIDARIKTKLGDIGAARASLGRARELNPRSPVFLTP
jgi:hypothetical protein